jgi:hypothetical protein
VPKSDFGGLPSSRLLAILAVKGLKLYQINSKPIVFTVRGDRSTVALDWRLLLEDGGESRSWELKSGSGVPGSSSSDFGPTGTGMTTELSIISRRLALHTIQILYKCSGYFRGSGRV